MRRIVVWVLTLALLWSGWWWLATTGIGRGLEMALDQQREQGWTADIGTLRQSGFPLSLTTRLRNLQLVDPESGTRLSVPAAAVTAPAYWPGDALLELGDAPLTFGTERQLFGLRTTQGQIGMDLHPGQALELEAARISSGPWQLEVNETVLLDAARLAANLTETGDQAGSYDAALNADDLTLGQGLRQMLGLSGVLPKAPLNAAATLQVRFDAPLDRHALTAAPTPRLIAADLGTLDLRWGDIRITGTADLVFDDRGIPLGTVNLRIREWERLTQIASALGLPPERLTQTSLILRALANMDGDPRTLTLPLRFEEGQMFMGSIHLGPAPRMQ